jgi:uncharacterized membrane protein
MIGRAVFIHVGAMLGTIMLANVHRRIWPVERRRLTAASAGEEPPPHLVEAARLRLQHNAALAVAVVLIMVSNHFPVLYGNSRRWLFVPGIIVLGWLVSTMFSRAKERSLVMAAGERARPLK